MVLQFWRLMTGFGLSALMAPLAFAHHMEDGETPDTLMAGLLSGLGHPVIGLDHLLFVIGVGLAAAAAARPVSLPVIFVGATLLGVGLHVLGVNLPMVEPVIILSVLAVGVLMVAAVDTDFKIWGALFAIAGIFHGYAYGEAIVGSEATPLVAYLIGLAIIQSAIGAGVALLAGRVFRFGRPALRIGGGALAGAGLVFATALLPAIG